MQLSPRRRSVAPVRRRHPAAVFAESNAISSRCQTAIISGCKLSAAVVHLVSKIAPNRFVDTAQLLHDRRVSRFVASDGTTGSVSLLKDFPVSLVEIGRHQLGGKCRLAPLSEEPVSPRLSGGISLTWHSSAIYLDIYLYPTGNPAARAPLPHASRFGPRSGDVRRLLL